MMIGFKGQATKCSRSSSKILVEAQQ